jgi:hypothetical protein
VWAGVGDGDGGEDVGDVHLFSLKGLVGWWAVVRVWN